jgi:hypothetical protein
VIADAVIINGEERTVTVAPAMGLPEVASTIFPVVSGQSG